MSYQLAGNSFGSNLRIGEASGWATLLLSTFGLMKGSVAVIGAITPDLVNGWIILIGSTVTGAVAIGTIAYTRIIQTRLDGETREAINDANVDAIKAGKPVPYPAFLPKGAVVVTTTTTIDVQPPAKTESDVKEVS